MFSTLRLSLRSDSDPPTVRVLVAADKFKGSLSAVEVNAAIAAGLTRNDAVEVTTLPIADGGDGTVAAASSHGFDLHQVQVSGALHEPRTTDIALRGDTAIIEIATICGLTHHTPLRPLEASSIGVGEAILAATNLNARTIHVGLGGSSTTDGGAGMLSALGVRFTDNTGNTFVPSAATLTDICAVDWTHIDPRLLGRRLAVLCDVTNPLLGVNGAATVFGPQKGADENQIVGLGSGLAHLVEVLSRTPNPSAIRPPREAAEMPGAGAAGGIAFGALCLGAEILSGSDELLDLLHFDDAARDCAVIVTGEGRLDTQTLAGKAPSAVIARARHMGIPVVAVVGSSVLSDSRVAAEGIAAVHTLESLDTRCVDSPILSAQLLAEIGESIADALLSRETCQPAAPNSTS